MKLEDFEKLHKARTPGSWEAEIDCVDVGWVAIGPAHPVGGDAGPTEARADAAFIAACSEMVPRMIKALKAANALHMRFVHDETNTVKDSVTFLRLSITLAELEQP